MWASIKEAAEVRPMITGTMHQVRISDLVVAEGEKEILEKERGGEMHE